MQLVRTPSWPSRDAEKTLADNELESAGVMFGDLTDLAQLFDDAERVGPNRKPGPGPDPDSLRSQVVAPARHAL